MNRTSSPTRLHDRVHWGIECSCKVARILLDRRPNLQGWVRSDLADLPGQSRMGCYRRVDQNHFLHINTKKGGTNMLFRIKDLSSSAMSIFNYNPFVISL